MSLSNVQYNKQYNDDLVSSNVRQCQRSAVEIDVLRLATIGCIQSVKVTAWCDVMVGDKHTLVLNNLVGEVTVTLEAAKGKVTPTKVKVAQLD